MSAFVSKDLVHGASSSGGSNFAPFIFIFGRNLEGPHGLRPVNFFGGKSPPTPPRTRAACSHFKLSLLVSLTRNQSHGMDLRVEASVAPQKKGFFVDI